MTEQHHFDFSLSCIGEGNGNPLWYSCLGSPMGRGVWWTTVHRLVSVQHDLVTRQQHNFTWLIIFSYLIDWASPLGQDFSTSALLTFGLGCGGCLLIVGYLTFSSVQFSRSVMSDSLRPHASQHARLPCPSPTSGIHSNSRPSSRWCHQPSHPLLSPSPPAPNPSQHQGLF